MTYSVRNELGPSYDMPMNKNFDLSTLHVLMSYEHEGYPFLSRFLVRVNHRPKRRLIVYS